LKHSKKELYLMNQYRIINGIYITDLTSNNPEKKEIIQKLLDTNKLNPVPLLANKSFIRNLDFKKTLF